MSKNNELEYGKWYVDNTGICLNGILTLNHSSNEYELELYSDEQLEMPYSVDVIYGKTYQGKAFTLYKCNIGGVRSTSIVHDFKSKFKYQIRCDYLLEGGTFKKAEDIKMSEVQFSVSHLNDWAFQDAVDIKLNESSEFVITTNNIKESTYESEEFKFSILTSTSPDYQYKFSGTLKIKTESRLVFEFFSPTSLERIHNLIAQVKAFIALCTGQRIYIKYISALTLSIEQQDYVPIIKIYGPVIDFENDEEVHKLKRHKNYIKLEDIKEDFSLCMKNWFEKNERLEPVIELYLSLTYHRTSLERHFLNITQSLEAYHRLTRNNRILPKGEHSQKIKNIVENVPKEHQQWVKERLAFSNEPSLHDRLEELLTPVSKSNLEEYESKYYHLFRLQGKEKIDIIRDIKNTRNYNTHFDERLKKKAVKGEELFQLIGLLKLMVEFYLLTELDISEKIIIDLIWEKSNQLSIHSSVVEALKESHINL